MSKRVLFIYPWPLDEANGARLVLLAYARALVGRGMAVDCFAPCGGAVRPDGDGLYFGVFRRLFRPAHGSKTLQTLLAAAGAGCVDQALPSHHGCDPAAMFAAAAVASTGGYDLIAVHYTRLHAIQPLLPSDVPVVMFTYDLDAVVADQESAAFGTPPGRYTLDMEASRLSAFDAITTVGPHDRDRLLAVAPDLPVYSAPIPVPVRELPSSRDTDGQSILLMSSSATFHELSLAWFLSHAWPAIRNEHPQATLLLAGRICDTARRYGADGDPRIELLGQVAEPCDAYLRADVVIAPYYFGDGIKLKVLEALAHGLPLVTTTPGLSNTELLPDRHVLVADDGATFAAAVGSLLREPAQRTRLASNAVRYIEAHHSQAVAERALQGILETLLKGATRAVHGEGTDDSRTRRFVRHLQQSVAAALDASVPVDGALTPSHLATQLRVLLPWAVHRVRSIGARAVAIYGAGAHTRMLLPMWRALNGPQPLAVVVTGRPAEPWCNGVPVVSLDEFDATGVDAVVVSSHGYEHAMTAAWQARFPRIPVFSIWSPPSIAGMPAMPVTSETIPAATTYAQTVHR